MQHSLRHLGQSQGEAPPTSSRIRCECSVFRVHRTMRGSPPSHRRLTARLRPNRDGFVVADSRHFKSLQHNRFPLPPGSGTSRHGTCSSGGHANDIDPASGGMPMRSAELLCAFGSRAVTRVCGRGPQPDGGRSVLVFPPKGRPIQGTESMESTRCPGRAATVDSRIRPEAPGGVRCTALHCG